MILVLALFGILSIVSALIPLVAIAPILLYIGMLIGSQAFQETKKSHAPAIVLALVPHVAAWGKLQIDSALQAAGTNAATVGMEKLGQGGVLYEGLGLLGGGSILGGLILGAIGVFIIERDFVKAATFSLAGSVMTFFGFMHGEAIGIAESPSIDLFWLQQIRDCVGAGAGNGVTPWRRSGGMIHVGAHCMRPRC